ncbi:hypothetical protein [Yersinia ruckeri]|uniref:Uncharacterized protein n=1 Tax=Yersinia ruckeri TaxID=29486 RepID=A0A085U755_YERRU|nr:hypothetical protein [Yersinia ruckeri]ARY99480.1 hypothetical protein QMA0440_00098 [Yersinia ruckeri]EEP97576.1 hypothetical protein yruck0001_60 [Yersinia ruckeri ATCC 29473]EKN4687528.1 hypothetical protein [Yersinia ruckeri]EKN4691573.1 hypothetical protein [Yersinia ruckeri]EKN4695562.1 hypothetical protein [Yersinia ruckeri]
MKAQKTHFSVQKIRPRKIPKKNDLTRKKNSHKADNVVWEEKKKASTRLAK